MRTVQDSIGTKFERFIQGIFPELERREGRNLPDFYHSDGFYLEAKAGNIRWGTRLKRYQIESFMGITEPVVYAMGYHNFDDAYERLGGRSETRRQRVLDAELDFLQVLFVSGDLVRRIWSKEKRTNKKGTIEYCMFKTGLANALVYKKSFRRFGKKVEPEEYYGFSYRNYLIFESEISGVKYRGVLHKRRDELVIDFLREKGIIR